MESNKLHTMALAIEGAFAGFGFLRYKKHGDAYHILFDDYHTIENAINMVEALDKSIKIYDRDFVESYGAYCAVLEHKR